MQPGISSFAFGWGVTLGCPPMNELGVVGFARCHALGVVQLGDNLPLHERSRDQRAALKVAADAAGVTLELGARGLSEAHLKTYLDLCGEMRSSMLRFVIDAADYEPALPRLTSLLRNATPAIDAAGVTLGIENHDRFRAAELRRLIDAVGSPRVGVCLDTANSLGAGEGLEHVAERLAPVTVNLHVKDVTIRRLPHLMGFTIVGCTLGQGQLPIHLLLDRMRAGGYRGSVILEAWWPSGADDAATVAGELASAVAGIQTLKQWLQS
jgi:sugar phosphate isomerase/epimerase